MVVVTAEREWQGVERKSEKKEGFHASEEVNVKRCHLVCFVVTCGRLHRTSLTLTSFLLLSCECGICM